MRLRAAGLAALVWMVLGHAADNQDWVAIPSTAPNITFAVDVASIQRNGDLVEFMEKLTYLKPDQIDTTSGRTIKEKRVLRIMNCKERTQGFSMGSKFSDAGTLIERMTIEPNQVVMRGVPATSLAERELELVCGWSK